MSMRNDAILVTFAEIFLKGKNKMEFVKRIVRTIKKKTEGSEVFISFTEDHILIVLNGFAEETVREALDKIFGIHSYLVGKTCESKIEDIVKTAGDIVKRDVAVGEKIKIETKRSWKEFPIKSPEVSKLVAECLLGKFAAALSVVEPDKIVFVVIKDKFSIVGVKKVRALGGLPVGLSGRSLVLLSGGIDSPVAAYLMMKRGLIADCLHFESQPHTSVKARQKVLDVARILAKYLPNGEMHVRIVNFTALQEKVFEKVPPRFAMIVMRRMMLRIADRIAYKHGMHLIATGDSIGQVASQTPASIHVINAVTNYPVIRPLACFDKNETVELAKKIGTFNISIRPFEDCCTVFVPDNPATQPAPEKVMEAEKSFEFGSFIVDCVRNAESLRVFADSEIILDRETTSDIDELFK